MGVTPGSMSEPRMMGKARGGPWSVAKECKLGKTWRRQWSFTLTYPATNEV